MIDPLSLIIGALLGAVFGVVATLSTDYFRKRIRAHNPVNIKKGLVSLFGTIQQYHSEFSLDEFGATPSEEVYPLLTKHGEAGFGYECFLRLNIQNTSLNMLKIKDICVDKKYIDSGASSAIVTYPQGVGAGGVKRTIMLQYNLDIDPTKAQELNFFQGMQMSGYPDYFEFNFIQLYPEEEIEIILVPIAKQGSFKINFQLHYEIIRREQVVSSVLDKDVIVSSLKSVPIKQQFKWIYDKPYLEQCVIKPRSFILR